MIIVVYLLALNLSLFPAKNVKRHISSNFITHLLIAYGFQKTNRYNLFQNKLQGPSSKFKKYNIGQRFKKHMKNFISPYYIFIPLSKFYKSIKQIENTSYRQELIVKVTPYLDPIELK